MGGGVGFSSAVDSSVAARSSALGTASERETADCGGKGSGVRLATARAAA